MSTLPNFNPNAEVPLTGPEIVSLPPVKSVGVIPEPLLKNGHARCQWIIKANTSDARQCDKKATIGHRCTTCEKRGMGASKSVAGETREDRARTEEYLQGAAQAHPAVTMFGSKGPKPKVQKQPGIEQDPPIVIPGATRDEGEVSETGDPEDTEPPKELVKSDLKVEMTIKHYYNVFPSLREIMPEEIRLENGISGDEWLAEMKGMIGSKACSVGVKEAWSMTATAVEMVSTDVFKVRCRGFKSVVTKPETLDLVQLVAEEEGLGKELPNWQKLAYLVTSAYVSLAMSQRAMYNDLINNKGRSPQQAEAILEELATRVEKIK